MNVTTLSTQWFIFNHKIICYFHILSFSSTARFNTRYKLLTFWINTDNIHYLPSSLEYFCHLGDYYKALPNKAFLQQGEEEGQKDEKKK